MVSRKTVLSFVVLIAVCCFFAVRTGAQTQDKSNQVRPAPVGATAERGGLEVDQARMSVRDIPTVDIRATLASWKLQEPQLVKLRQWSSLLVEDSERSDFLPKWAELMTETKSKKVQAQTSDVVSLIQMVMLAAYEEANKNLDSYAEKVKLYEEMKDRLRANLTEARQMQALLRSQRPDPLSGSLIRLPANQRTLQKCQMQSGPTLKLDCRPGLVSTTIELDNYQTETNREIEKAEKEANQTSLDLEKMKQRRREKLEALSDVFKKMYDAAVVALR